MYWLVFGLLIIGVLCEIYKDTYYGKAMKLSILHRYNKYSLVTVYFVLIVILMTIMAALRYGQGTDYFSYKKLFTMTNLSYVYVAVLEPIYKLTAYTFHILGIPYEVFVALLAIFEMICFWRFIQKYSPYKILSLLLLYPTLYLTYIYSCFRQAVAVAIFCGICIPFLQNKKWIKYYAAVLVAAGFHKTALLLLLVPVFLKIPYKWLCRMIIIAVVGGIIFCMLDVSTLLQFLLQEKAAEHMKVWGYQDISLMGIAERTMMMTFILWGGRKYWKEEKKDEFGLLLCKIYVVGYMVSLGAMRYSLISSRLGVYFKSVEIVLIPILISQMKPALRKIIVTVLLLYSGVFFVKNISMYISQGGYLNKSIWNYPYISIFTKESVNRDMITGWPGIYDKRDHLGGYIRHKYIIQ